MMVMVIIGHRIGRQPSEGEFQRISLKFKSQVSTATAVIHAFYSYSRQQIHKPRPY
jgi:hypothetical protein